MKAAATCHQSVVSDFASIDRFFRNMIILLNLSHYRLVHIRKNVIRSNSSFYHCCLLFVKLMTESKMYQPIGTTHVLNPMRRKSDICSIPVPCDLPGLLKTVFCTNPTSNPYNFLSDQFLFHTNSWESMDNRLWGGLARAYQRPRPQVLSSQRT